MAKLILITGGSSSGKTTVARNVKEALGEKALFLSQDMFYKPQKTPMKNYDVPEAFDWDLQHQVIRSLKGGKKTNVPIYSFEKNDRIGWKTVNPKSIIVFEGLFSFWDSEICENADLQIFVDTPADTRLARRLFRDLNERNREPINIINRWLKDVAPSYNKYIKKMKKKADIILPWEKVGEKGLSTLIIAIKEMSK